MKSEPDRGLDFVPTDMLIAELKARFVGLVIVYMAPAANGEPAEYHTATIECNDEIQSLGLLDYGKALLLRHMFSRKGP